MQDEDVDFERITQIYREEHRKKGLTHLPQNFFEKLGEYIDELRRNCEEEESRDLRSPKAVMLGDELRKAVKKREEIWMLRMRKLVTAASSKLMGATTDTKAFTKEEAEVYDRVVNILEEYTGDVYRSGPRSAKIEEKEAPKAIAEVKTEKKAVEEFEAKEVDVKKQTKLGTRSEVVVQILEDLPPLAGPDENYHLKKNDFATLPKHLAKVLLDKKKARTVEVLKV
jgi:DNA replication initiation complex subunit (GINS family)